jgi:hypothetical protein
MKEEDQNTRTNTRESENFQEAEENSKPVIVVLQGIRREGCEGGLAEQRNIL